jgi:hypothetical protein
MNFGNSTTKAIIFLISFLITGAAYAGAWTQSSGKWLFVQNISYYSTSKFFDNSGKKQNLNNYNKYELNPYIEYGLRDDVTIGANLFLQRASQNNMSNWGIGDSEFFIRKQLWEKDGFVFSVEPMIKLPSIESSSQQPQIGNRNFDTVVTFSGGYSFKAWGLNHFTNLNTGYRHRFGTQNDQFKLEATAGLSLSKKYMLLAQAFNTTRLTDTIQPAFTQSSSDDYDLTKLQISAIYKMDDKLSFQAGAFSHVAGRNVGSGSGAIIAINRNF